MKKRSDNAGTVESYQLSIEHSAILRLRIVMFPYISYTWIREVAELSI